jgi:hypothetical protein
VDVVSIDDSDNSDDGSGDSANMDDIQEFHDKFTAPPVRVPRVVNPFANLPELGRIFKDTFKQADDLGIIPEGYGMWPDEWIHDAYPSFYHIQSGKNGGRELKVELPDLIWRPRAEMWVRALNVYNNLLAQLDINH